MKPLHRQLEDTKRLVTSQMSDYKTSLKQLMVFLRCYRDIEQNYIKEVNMLRLTGGKTQLYSKKSFNRLKETDNPTVVDVVSTAQSYLISVEDVHQNMVTAIDKALIPDINRQYLFQKQAKLEHLQSIKQLAKQRDEHYKDPSNLIQREQQHDSFNNEVIVGLQDILSQMQAQNQSRTQCILDNMVRLQDIIQSKQKDILDKTRQTAAFVAKVELSLEDQAISQFSLRLKQQQEDFQNEQRHRRQQEINKRTSSQYNSYNSQDYLEYSQKINDTDMIKIKMADNLQIENEISSRAWFQGPLPVVPSRPALRPCLFEEQWFLWADEYLQKKHCLLPDWVEDVSRIGSLQGHVINIFLYFLFQRHFSLQQHLHDTDDLQHFNQYIWNTLRHKELYKKKISLPALAKTSSKGLDYIYEQMCKPVEENPQAQPVSSTFLLMLVLNQYWHLEEHQESQNWLQDMHSTLSFFDQPYNQGQFNRLSQQFMLTQMPLSLSFTFKANLVAMLLDRVFSTSPEFLYDFRLNDSAPLFFQVTPQVLLIDPPLLMALFLKRALLKILSDLVFSPARAYKHLIQLDTLFSELPLHTLHQRPDSEDPLIRLYKIQSMESVIHHLESLLTSLQSIRSDSPQVMSALGRSFLLCYLSLQTYRPEQPSPLQVIGEYLEVSASQIIRDSTQRYKVKFSLNEHQNVFLDTLFQMLHHLNQEIAHFNVYIIVMAGHLSRIDTQQDPALQKETQKNYQKQLAMRFFQCLTKELKEFCELYSSKISLIHDETARMFNIAFELSNLDQFILELTQDPCQEVMLESIGPAVELWVQQVQHENKQLAEKCSAQDTTLSDKECSDQTLEFCSIVFKGLEIIRDIIIKNKNQKFKLLIQKRLEIVIHESILDYIKRIQQSATLFHPDKRIFFNKIEKSTFFTKALSYVNSHSNTVANFGQIKKLIQKMKNLDFINKQIGILLGVLHNKSSIIDNLREDIITVNLSVYSTLSHLVVTQHLHFIFFQKLFQQQDFILLQKVGVLKYSEEHEHSMCNLLPEIEDYFYSLTLIQTDLVVNNKQQHLEEFVDVFCRRFLVEAFDQTKFKGTSNHNLVSSYLKNELQVLLLKIGQIFGLDEKEEFMRSQSVYYRTMVEYYQLSSECLLQRLGTLAVHHDSQHMNIVMRVLAMRRKYDKKDKRVGQALKDYESLLEEGGVVESSGVHVLQNGLHPQLVPELVQHLPRRMAHTPPLTAQHTLEAETLELLVVQHRPLDLLDVEGDPVEVFEVALEGRRDESGYFESTDDVPIGHVVLGEVDVLVVHKGRSVEEDTFGELLLVLVFHLEPKSFLGLGVDTLVPAEAVLLEESLSRPVLGLFQGHLLGRPVHSMHFSHPVARVHLLVLLAYAQQQQTYDQYALHLYYKTQEMFLDSVYRIRL